MQTIRISHKPCTLPSVLCACLPPSLVDAVGRCEATAVEELRLHAGRYATVTSRGRSLDTGILLSDKELSEILKRMCQGSLYAYSQTINQGYLTMPGGIRVGVCGTAAVEGGEIIGISAISGLMIRIPHAVNVSPAPVLERFLAAEGLRGILVYAPPGHGKTTLLRAVTAALASPPHTRRTVAVDTRAELQFGLEDRQLNLDILVGYPRATGIEIAVRTMGAEVIVCDEIGNAADAHAILLAANCGVPLVASAHAATLSELLERPFMQSLHRAHVFGTYVGIRRGGPLGFTYLFTDWHEADKGVRV
ncbi:MAG: hypothetical protein IJW29_04445 [Clostridia bacterium]|nr:hypothetical protein [Clostridia bacterium]